MLHCRIGSTGQTRKRSTLATAIGYRTPGLGLKVGALVQRARDGAGRLELARAIPKELLEQVCALGSPDRLTQRIDAYHDAGADTVAVVPSTAEDPGGRAVLGAVTKGRREPLAPARPASAAQTGPRTKEIVS
jgi:hypothetical protein